MLGKTKTAMITFNSHVVPRYVYYHGGETECNPYQPTKQVCYVCQRIWDTDQTSAPPLTSRSVSLAGRTTRRTTTSVHSSAPSAARPTPRGLASASKGSKVTEGRNSSHKYTSAEKTSQSEGAGGGSARSPR
ncbi:unnamed protein product [Ixodes persulcatus]